MMRFRLSKAFFAWKDRFGQVDKNFAMRRKLQSTINKGRMRRAFLGWRKVRSSTAGSLLGHGILLFGLLFKKKTAVMAWQLSQMY